MADSHAIFSHNFHSLRVAFYSFSLTAMNRNSCLPAGAYSFSWINSGSLLGHCQLKQVCMLYYGSSVAEILLYLPVFLARKIF